MKNLYLLFAFILFAGCSDENKQPEFSRVKIEKQFPYVIEKQALGAANEEILNVFNQKIVAVNSAAGLEANPIYPFIPDALKAGFSECDYGKYTLVIATSSCIAEVRNVTYNLYMKSGSPFEYTFNVSLQCALSQQPYENLYLITISFLVEKMPDESEIRFTAVGITEA